MHGLDEKCIQIRSRCRLNNNIKMSFKVVWKGADWIHLAQDGLATNSCVH
jgi:hypothetical protein